MIEPLKTASASLANHSGLLDSYAFLRRKFTKSQVAILLYHRICPQKYTWSLKPFSPQIFQSQLEYLCRNYEILPLDSLVQYIRQGRSLPEKAAVITFDDGYKDNYLYAYPILKKHHAPATIFLTTGHIGTGELFWFDKVKYAIQHSSVDRLELDELGIHTLQADIDKNRVKFIIKKLKNLPEGEKQLLIQKLLNLCQVNIPPGLGKELILSWDEVREMHSNGISFGAHSVSHPILTNLPLEQARNEIIQSKKDIEEKLGQDVTAFSYPNGDFNAEIIELLRESSFTCAVTCVHRLISPKTNPYQLCRILVSQDFNKFKLALSWLYHDLGLNRLSE